MSTRVLRKVRRAAYVVVFLVAVACVFTGAIAGDTWLTVSGIGAALITGVGMIGGEEE